jgi:alkylated DNA repair dioxygenase AlkB
MGAVRQLSLLAVGEPEPADAAPVEHRPLDADCWVDLSRGWLRGADALFEQCTRRLRWSQRERAMYGELVAEPRLTAPVPLQDPTTPSVVARCAERLSTQYGAPLRAAWANWYRDGDDAVAWHADRIGRTEQDPLVAVLTLGGPRAFAMRPKGVTGARAHRWVLHSGDLLVMGGACQHRWEHAVPRRRGAPPRISLTFRAVETRPDREPAPSGSAAPAPRAPSDTPRRTPR